MQFLNNIKSSIYSPAFYKEIFNKPFSHSLRYFLSVAAAISLVMTIVFSFSALPEMNKIIGEIGPYVMKYYPDNLEVTVKNGKVSTNVPEPFFIKMPAELAGTINESKNASTKISPDLAKMENLFVIDTVSPLTTDLFKRYKTFVLISRDSAVYYDNDAIKIQSLGENVNGAVTKAKVSAALNKIMPFIRILPLALVPIIFIGSFLGSVFGYLIYLIFGAFVIWLAAKAMKRELGYGKAYQIGLHAITLGIILEFTVFWYYPNLEFPFFFTLLMLVVAWVNIRSFFGIDNIPPVPDGTSVAGGKI